VTLFLILAFLTIGSALTVILHRSPVYSALALVNTLFLLAVLFVLLDAHLVAALQVIVYAGAIMVLFLFVIMLLSLTADPHESGRIGLRSAAAAGGVLLALELGLVGWGSALRAQLGDGVEIPSSYGSIESLAEQLFTKHLLPFELTSLLLLVAIVGSVVMARRRV
jgi:NADH-quinone oxidoreductase subunit J